MKDEIRTDFLVIGSGIAGLNFALKTARYGSVAVVTKKGMTESSTFHAQGGIAAALAGNDSFRKHITDTMKTGDGLCHRDVVEFVVKDAPERVLELACLGVRFTRNEKDPAMFDLGREGGHFGRRIVHVSDRTGYAIQNRLTEKALGDSGIRIYEDFIAVNLIVTKDRSGGKKHCWGAYVLDKKKKRVLKFLADITVLATGGAGKVYIYTSNPDVATGDGVAMAYRSGARIANMEFIQFHPTCLYHPEAKSFLISESVRGEGGILRTGDGKPFMHRYHRMGNLAPRDVVARAIDREMKKSGDDFVLLDITHKPKKFIKKRFPHIDRQCRSFGLDITREPIPVVPAAHYSCGGVMTDRFGKTNIRGLYAIGETACTGLHGANRLASNSLLEALVFSHRAAEKAGEEIRRRRVFPKVLPWKVGRAVDSSESVIVAHNWDEIRRLMWNYVGIVRSDKRLARAKRRIRLLQNEINEYYWNFIITSDLIELRNIATVAELIIDSALRRKESRGLHYSLDYPGRDDRNWKKDTVLSR